MLRVHLSLVAIFSEMLGHLMLRMNLVRREDHVVNVAGDSAVGASTFDFAWCNMSVIVTDMCIVISLMINWWSTTVTSVLLDFWTCMHIFSICMSMSHSSRCKVHSSKAVSE